MELVLLIPVQVLSLLLLMEGLRNLIFIIPRPRRKNKREMPEMQGKTPAFPPTSCPEPAGMSLRDDMVQGLFVSS